MSQRITIFICDSDADFRQDLISQFATSVEDFRLIGVENIKALKEILNSFRFKIDPCFLVANSTIFDPISDHKSTQMVFKRISQNIAIEQVVVYSENEEKVRNNNLLSKQKKFICIPQNDFTFFRIQNTIRNFSNLKEYKQSKIGLAISVAAFFGLSIWFYFV